MFNLTMPETFTILSYFVFALISPCCHKQAIALTPTLEWNRVVLAYHAATDRCEKVTDTSHPEAVAAANWECEKAFEALDSVKLNSCHGWRHGACRKFDGVPLRQCSCTLNVCDYNGIRNNQPVSFRDCSISLWTKELYTGEVPTTTLRYRSARKVFNQNALHIWRTRHLRTTTSSSRGSGSSWGRVSQTSSSPSIPQGVGPSVGQYVQYAGSIPIDGAVASSAGASSSSPAIDLVFTHTKTSETFKCDTCPKKYATAGALRDHQRCHADDGVVCPICGANYTMRRNLTVHIKQNHKELAAAEAVAAKERYIDENPYPCTTCPKRFKSRKGLEDHTPVHTGDAHCDQCGQDFTRRSLYMTHKRKEHPK